MNKSKRHCRICTKRYKRSFEPISGDVKDNFFQLTNLTVSLKLINSFKMRFDLIKFDHILKKILIILMTFKFRHAA